MKKDNYFATYVKSSLCSVFIGYNLDTVRVKVRHLVNSL